MRFDLQVPGILYCHDPFGILGFSVQRFQHLEHHRANSKCSLIKWMAKTLKSPLYTLFYVEVFSISSHTPCLPRYGYARDYTGSGTGLAGENLNELRFGGYLGYPGCLPETHAEETLCGWHHLHQFSCFNGLPWIMPPQDPRRYGYRGWRTHQRSLQWVRVSCSAIPPQQWQLKCIWWFSSTSLLISTRTRFSPKRTSPEQRLLG